MSQPKVFNHAARRMQQRGIRPEAIDLAVMRGRSEWSYGSHCYTLTARALRGTAFEREASRFQGVQAVVSADNTLVTAKRLRESRRVNWRPRRRRGSYRDWV